MRGLVDHAERLPAAAVVEGEPGIGKTTVWRLGVESARDAGYRVLACAPAEAESALSFAALRDLVEPVLETILPRLPAPQRRALEVALLLSEPADRPPESAAIAAAFTGAVRALADSGPVLLAVDDVQWLDHPTASVIGFAARRLGDAPVAILAAQRRLPAGSSLLGLEEALGADRVARIRLGGLSAGALHYVLQTRLGRSFPRPVLLKLHAASAGNPLHALELAGVIEDRGGTVSLADELPLPRSIEEAFARRLDTLPAATRDALLVLALDPNATDERLGRVLGTPSELEPALAAGIVARDDERLRLTHPLLATAVVQAADPSQRRSFHRLLALQAPDSEERARHLALAAERPDAEAAEALEEAAVGARLRGAPSTALGFLEQALRLIPEEDEPGWVRLSIAGSAIAHDVGDFDRGRRLAGDVVRRIGPGPDRARALLHLSTCSPRPAFDLCQQALAEAGDDPDLRARIHLLLADHRFFVDLRAAHEDVRAAVHAAEASEDAGMLIQALTLLGFVEAARGLESASETLDRARELAEWAVPPPPVYFSPEANLGVVLLWRDELDAARALLVPAYERAKQEGDEYGRMWIRFHLAQLEWRAGDLRQAAEHASESLELWDESGDIQGRNTAVWVRAAIDASLGALDAARDAAVAGLALTLELEDRLFAARQHALLAFVAVSEDDFAAAADHSAVAHRLVAEYGVGEPGLILYAGDAVEALIRLGRLEEAESRIDELEGTGAELDRPRLLATASRCRGLLLVERGLLDDAVIELERALALHERFTAELERGRTLLAFGSTQRRAKRRADARSTLGTAVALFDRVGARAWADKARAELDRIGGRVASGGLTPSEQRVAELVVEGRSNKKVAAELFVSVKTVEGHLSRIYEKLGVHSRAELAHRLRGKD